MECVELAPAFEPRYTSDSGSKLHALHTLRAIWFRLSRAEDRRALPPPVLPNLLTPVELVVSWCQSETGSAIDWLLHTLGVVLALVAGRAVAAALRLVDLDTVPDTRNRRGSDARFYSRALLLARAGPGRAAVLKERASSLSDLGALSPPKHFIINDYHFCAQN